MANNFSPEVADKLLEQLSSDDTFRALFARNPRAALRKLGHETPETDRDELGSDPLLCVYAVRTLASKEQIQDARAQLRMQLTSKPFSFAMAALDAG